MRQREYIHILSHVLPYIDITCFNLFFGYGGRTNIIAIPNASMVPYGNSSRPINTHTVVHYHLHHTTNHYTINHSTYCYVNH